MKKLLFCCILSIPYLASTAQDIPLDQVVQNRFNELTISADTGIFTSFRSMNWLELKPYLRNRGGDVMDSVFGFSRPASSYAFKNLGTSNWIMAAGGNHLFAVDPIISASGGFGNTGNGTMVTAVGGIRVQGIISDRFSYSVSYQGGYRKYAGYVNDFIDSNHVQPGLGKGTLTGNNGYTSSQVTANITYNGGEHFLAAAGYGKNFIGDGYRTLILSDNASNNPYIRVQAKVWKLTYNVLFNKYTTPRFSWDNDIIRKFSVMHYLGVNFSDKFQMALYDNVNWITNDSFGQRGFDVAYLNPLIFMRPLEYAIGSPDNAFVGITFKYKFYKKGFLYGQLGLDDINLSKSLENDAQHFGNKYGLQLGVWNKDFLGLQNLSWRFEWNTARPYMYGHGFGKTGSNLTHNNQALTNPMNANFHEFISIFNYHHERWFGILHNSIAIRGENPGLPYNNGEDLWGGEIGVPVYGSKTLQGNKNNYFYNQASLGYLLNPRNRLALQADLVYRHRSAPDVSSSTFFFNIGIKTGLFNYYHDL